MAIEVVLLCNSSKVSYRGWERGTALLLLGQPDKTSVSGETYLHWPNINSNSFDRKIRPLSACGGSRNYKS